MMTWWFSRHCTTCQKVKKVGTHCAWELTCCDGYDNFELEFNCFGERDYCVKVITHPQLTLIGTGSTTSLAGGSLRTN